MTSRCETTDKKLGRECRRVIDDLASIHDAVTFVLEYSQIRRDRTCINIRVHRIAIRTANLLSLHALRQAKARMITRQD